MRQYALDARVTLVGERALLGIIFDENTTIGMVRLYAQEASNRLAEIFQKSDDENQNDDIGHNFTDDAKGKLNDVFGK